MTYKIQIHITYHSKSQSRKSHTKALGTVLEPWPWHSQWSLATKQHWLTINFSLRNLRIGKQVYFSAQKNHNFGAKDGENAKCNANDWEANWNWKHIMFFLYCRSPNVFKRSNCGVMRWLVHVVRACWNFGWLRVVARNRSLIFEILVECMSRYRWDDSYFAISWHDHEPWPADKSRLIERIASKSLVHESLITTVIEWRPFKTIMYH